MSDSRAVVTAAVIIIGNEILSGRTREGNLPYLAQELNVAGVRLREARIVPDVEEVIVEAVNTLRGAYDYVFTTGGIGPTHDDITAAAIARAFGVPLERNPEAVQRLESYYARPDVPLQMSEARLRMANIPRGAELVDNPVSAAPGFRLENVYVFAGVPAIMRAMFDAVRHQLVGGAPIGSRELVVALPESEVARTLAEVQQRYPEVDMGSYPFMRSGRFGTSLVLRCADEARLEAAARELRGRLRELGAEPGASGTEAGAGDQPEG